MEPAERMVLVNVTVNSLQLIVQVSYKIFTILRFRVRFTSFHLSQHFVILTQHAMAKELVEMMDNANVRMVYLEKIAQVNFQSA
jgi:hypothetical protein